MPELPARTTDGARDAVALLEALAHGDKTGAEVIINHCDGPPTIFALASAWLAVVTLAGLDTNELLAGMRETVR